MSDEVIWRKLKPLEQIMLENPGCKKYDGYGIELTLIDESNGIYWTMNDEMLPMFGNDEEYAFKSRDYNKNFNRSSIADFPYTHDLDTEQMEHGRFGSGWSFHESWFIKENRVQLIQFTDEEFMI